MNIDNKTQYNLASPYKEFIILTTSWDSQLLSTK